MNHLFTIRLAADASKPKAIAVIDAALKPTGCYLCPAGNGTQAVTTDDQLAGEVTREAARQALAKLGPLVSLD